MKITKCLSVFLLAVCTSLVLGCGEGGSGESTPSTPSTPSHEAHAGAPSHDAPEGASGTGGAVETPAADDAAAEGEEAAPAE